MPHTRTSGYRIYAFFSWAPVIRRMIFPDKTRAGGSRPAGPGRDHPGELSQTLVGSNPWIDGMYTALCT